MLIFSFAKVVFWAQLGIFIYNMGSIGEFNLKMQLNLISYFRSHPD